MEKHEFKSVQKDASEEFYIIEQLTADGHSYLLVSDADPEEEEDAAAYILRDDSDPEDENALYTEVEDDAEFTRIAMLFDKLLAGEEINLEVEIE